MKERPLIMYPHEVRAVRDGRQTQFRRVVKPQPTGILAETFTSIPLMPSAPVNLWARFAGQGESRSSTHKCPYGVPGDRLYVKETWQAYEPQVRRFGGPGVFAGMKMRVYAYPPIEGKSLIEYKADHPDSMHGWRSSSQMPRWASRLLLEVVSVRVELLWDITVFDLFAEGIQKGDGGFGAYEKLWNAINGKAHPWASNPWVWATEFKRID